VILCHGIIQNRLAFAVPSFSVPQFLNDAGFDVYAVDMRGRDGGTGRHDFGAYVDEDAVAVVGAVAARHPRVSWIGHSMGGLIGVAMPVVVDSIVALASPLLPGTAALRGLAVDRRLAWLSRRTARRGIAFPGKTYSRAFVALRKLLDRGLVPFPLPLWKPGSFGSDEDLAFALDAGFSDDGHHVLADLCELGVSNGVRAGRVAFSERLRALRTPLLCVAGAVDALAPPDSVHALFSRAGSPDKRFLEVDAGHIDVVLGKRARAEVWPAVVDFLRAA
jgi:polyhydroxyalkanoate synthase